MDSEIKLSENRSLNGPRVAVFIDAANIWAVQKSKGMLFDYEKLQSFLREKYAASNLQIFFYSAHPAEGTRDFDLNGQHKFFTYLKKKLGFIMRTKQLKPMQHAQVSTESNTEPKEKGNMDVEITIDAIRWARSYDIAIFFSGDSDFLPLITRLRNFNKKIYVFSSKNNISRELRTGADGYYDLLRVKEDIWRGELKHRDAKK